MLNIIKAFKNWKRKRLGREEKEREKESEWSLSRERLKHKKLFIFGCIFVAENPRRYNLFISLDIYYTVGTGLALYLHYLEWGLLIVNPNCTPVDAFQRKERNANEEEEWGREGEKERARRVAVSTHALVLCHTGNWRHSTWPHIHSANGKVGTSLPL